MLKAMRGCLTKAMAQAETLKFDPAVLASARLYPNMFPLTRQIQIATDFAKGAPARLAGMDPPKYEDNETTLPQLIARIDRTIEFLKPFRPEQIDGQEARDIHL